MPAISLTVNTIPRLLQPRDTPEPSTPPPFPPFRQPNDGNDDGAGPFRINPDDHHDGDRLSPGIIAAIVVSIIVFFFVLTGLLAYLGHRKRRSRRDEIALKEESTSVTAVTASGALDPPPPYDEVHFANRAPARGYRGGSRSDITSSAEEEEEEAMGSHATITDGMEPGRHSVPGRS
ncbi:hypothetical protein C8A00DRAFT_37861 [Chaetomidium leptoderma]|uniref:Uncharacterized protein n=1 Tax=Chaetomidium leptoderma TaxID=669021 RepID=A0AAN6VFG7_9PEZI|nr:hypothetical protein C8A00DRAFT_37861 [Chaetomidium leptoderma]